MSSSIRPKTYVLKVVLCGDGAVGKTSLRQIYLGEGFETSYHETIGADFALKYSKINLPDSDEPRLFKFQIWDIAGQPRYTQVRSILFDRSDGGLLLFDLTNRQSLENTYDWLQTYIKYAGTGTVVLVGNKSDIRDDSDNPSDGMFISKEEGKAYADKLSKEFNRPIPYIETSAKNGINVDKAFEMLATTWISMTKQ